jgi:Tol biopolymer transport system component
MSSPIITESGKRACLDRILGSPEFAQAGRMREFLRFLGEQAIAHSDAPAVKETVIGVEVFGRDPGYDPKVDSVVRTEARRLRLKLQDYYNGSGTQDELRVEIPKGAYQVAFVSRESGAASAVEIAPPAPPPRWTSSSIATIAALAVGGAILLHILTRETTGSAGSRPQSPSPEPLLLTQSIGQATHPSLTADGETVVYSLASGDNSGIYVLRMDGRSMPVKLAGTRARDYNPVIDADGQKVAFLREESPTQFALMVQAIAGAAAQRWATLDRRDRVAWLPGPGNRLIASLRLNPAGPAVLAILDSSGGRTILTSPPPGTLHDGLPTLSPDFKTLAFTRATDVSVDEIYTVELGPDFVPRTEARRLTNEKRRFAGFCFSPDGRSILASLQRGRSVRGLWRIPLANPESGIERVPEAGIQAAYPVVSPKSGRVVYAIGVDDLNLYRRTASGAVTPLSHSNTLDSSPAISPDGKEVAFRSARSGASEIWIANLDGGNPRRLTFINGPVTGSPRWSPDGRWIAYDTRLDGNADIWVVSADGKNSERITALTSNEVVPAWSRDGRHIYYASDQSGSGWELWKLPVDTAKGTAAGVATRVTLAGGFRAEESPDGKWLYYSKREPQSGLWRIPLSHSASEEAVAPLQPSHWGGWTLSSTGVYLLDSAQKPPVVRFLGAPNREPVPLKNLPVLWESSLSAAPDNQQIIYTQLDSAYSDLYRIELRR